MPFVKKSFKVDRPIKAFLYLIRSFNYSQGEAQRLIARGRLLINNISMKDSSKVIYGDIEIVYFEPKGRGVKPIFQTNDFMIFEKDSGILVHPNTMATEYSMLDDIREVAGDYANGVHRIDMETSGLLMASKHKKSESSLKGLFEKRVIKKSYLAWVYGKVTKPFNVDKSISIRDDYTTSKHKVKIDSNGKSAYTEFFPLLYNKDLDASLISCFPHTGRTHQIRIHLFDMGYPILGDPIYGTEFNASDRYLEGKISTEDRFKYTGASRLMLHAQSLKFFYKNNFIIESKINFENMKSKICPKKDRI
ncbi:Putative ribosomal pseudouridine synthase [hydrothermal vent metagenome]|uniref:Putative ribosomal pseudouridine synthase n=1 Tax=hydrothermal vent metagenome TaxID=652676 RepID=A0A1W1BL33_9ZZZZ